MISVATNVWIAFLQRSPTVAPLVGLLEEHAVEVHPYVLAELELGDPHPRGEELHNDLRKLVGKAPQDHLAMLAFARQHGLLKSGISFVDTHLLSSAHAEGHLLWSLDDGVRDIARRIGVAFKAGAR